MPVHWQKCFTSFQSAQWLPVSTLNFFALISSWHPCAVQLMEHKSITLINLCLHRYKRVIEALKLLEPGLQFERNKSLERLSRLFSADLGRVVLFIALSLKVFKKFRRCHFLVNFLRAFSDYVYSLHQVNMGTQSRRRQERCVSSDLFAYYLLFTLGVGI